MRNLTMFGIGAVAVWLTLLVACGGGAKSTAKFVGTPTGKVVTNDVVDLALGTDLWMLAPGTTVVARTQESGLEVRERKLIVSDPETWAGSKVYALRAVAGEQFGPGDSGAPIIGSFGQEGQRVALAIFAGYDSGNLFGRNIDDMLLMVDEDAGTRAPSPLVASKIKPWPVQFFVTSPLAGGRYADFPANIREGSRNRPPLKFLGSRQASRGGGLEPPIGGSRFAAMVLDGGVTQIYLVASLTAKVPPNRGGNEIPLWLATGHSVLGLGKVEIPVRRAWVDSRIQGEYGGHVIAHPFADDFGVMTYDGPFGSIIRAERPPRATRLRTELKVGDNLPLWYDHRLARLNGHFYELLFASFGLADPILFRLGERGRSYTGSAQLTIGEEVLDWSPLDDPAQFVTELDRWIFEQVWAWGRSHPYQSLPPSTLSVEAVEVKPV